MQIKLWRSGLLALLLMLPTLALSGAFKVVPIKVLFKPGQTSTVVNVVNEGKENLKVELDIKQWSQSKAIGEDILTDSKDLIFFPKMLDIEPGKEKIIRIGFRGKPSSTEQTYRLLVKELPVIKPGEMALKFALRMSMPVFIKALHAKSVLSVASAEVSGGKLHVRVKNSGNSHTVVNKILASGEDTSGKASLNAEAGGWYVLAGATREFVVDLAAEACRKSKLIKIDVQADGNNTTSEIQVKASQCKADKS